MTKRKLAKTLQRKMQRLSDRVAMATTATALILVRKKYLLLFSIVLFCSVYFLTFFRDGTSYWSLLFSGVSLEEKGAILLKIFPAIIENFTSLYGISIIMLSLLQALCVMHLVFAWRHREREASFDGASTGGIGALLGFLALGCPSCGVSLFTPIMTAVAGAGAVALTESVSRFFTILAFFLLIFTVLQLGYVNFAFIGARKYKEKNAKSH